VPLSSVPLLPFASLNKLARYAHCCRAAAAAVLLLLLLLLLL